MEVSHQPIAGSPVDDAAWCADIAQRIGAGDSSAEDSFAARVRPGLLMLLMRRCAYDAELAADLCQDTLMIVLQRLRSRSIEDPARLAAFTAQTARQLAFDSRRRYALRKTVADSEIVEAAQIEAPREDAVEQASTASLVRKLLEELSHDRDREVLRRFYLLDQGKEEICLSFGIAPGTFDQVVFRARARLRTMLQARGTTGRDLLCGLTLWVPDSWLH
jgi:RNA polymerase sigma-70 factor (ECF subfamily)